jgi:capsular polysaccharide biosynthesis protein
MIILVGFGSATVLGIGAAYAADYFDPSFHTPAQVVDFLDIPVVIAVSKKTTDLGNGFARLHLSK